MSSASTNLKKTSQLRRLAGVLSSTYPGPAPTDAEGRRVIIPAVASDLVGQIVRAASRNPDGGLVVMVDAEESDDEIAVKTATLRVLHEGHDECAGNHTPFTANTTIGDILRILSPGSSTTFKMQDDLLAVNDVSEDKPTELPELIGAH